MIMQSPLNEFRLIRPVRSNTASTALHLYSKVQVCMCCILALQAKVVTSSIAPYAGAYWRVLGKPLGMQLSQTAIAVSFS